MANNDSIIEHEATVSKVSEDQLFYLMSRGLTKAQATEMIVMGFIEPFSRELPMEYAVELNQLIKLDMSEDAIGDVSFLFKKNCLLSRRNACI